MTSIIPFFGATSATAGLTEAQRNAILRSIRAGNDAATIIAAKRGTAYARVENDVITSVVNAFAPLQAASGLVNASQYNANAKARAQVSSELGLTKKLYNLDRLRVGLSNPSAYLQEKQLDIARIEQELWTIYQQERANALNRGRSLEEAEAAAKSVANQMKSAKMSIHEKDYPTEITKKVTEKLKGQ